MPLRDQMFAANLSCIKILLAFAVRQEPIKEGGILVTRGTCLASAALVLAILGASWSRALAEVSFNDLVAKIEPIPETAVLAGMTLHATSELDIYAYAGFERQQATFFATGPDTFFGVGLPNANNSRCTRELSTACSNDTKQTAEITAGFWDNIYKGQYGQLRGGIQYGYVTRNIFPSVIDDRSSASKTNDRVVYTSLRYDPFH